MSPTCPACGETADRAARFCENCGAPLSPTSTVQGCRCDTPDPDADGFCQTCGVKIARPAALADAAPDPDYEEFVDARLALSCDRGRRHPTNQDYGAVARRADGTAFLVVSDGVSTADQAATAARAAVAAAKACFLEGAAARPGTTLDEQARHCVEAAADAVLAVETSALDPDGGPAATIVLAVARERSAGIAWVGDSRAYLVMTGVPEELVTRDDSWCMQMVDAGRLSYEAAAADVNAHAITRWLGMSRADLAINAKSVAIPPGASLLLCSDGLWNHADGPGRLGTAYAKAARDDNRCTCRRLVALANAAGGHDNITVAILTP